MTTLSTNAPAQPNSISGFLFLIVETIFAVNMREKLDAQSSADKADAAYTWGL
jgi:hypothetical protein